jgi:hypothetical protein
VCEQWGPERWHAFSGLATDSPTPIPEAASIFLLGSGVVVAANRIRRRKSIWDSLDCFTETRTGVHYGRFTLESVLSLMKSRPRSASNAFFTAPTPGIASSAVSTEPPRTPLRRTAVPIVRMATTPPIHGIDRTSRRMMRPRGVLTDLLRHSHVEVTSKGHSVGTQLNFLDACCRRAGQPGDTL